MSDTYFSVLSFAACGLGCFSMWWSARKLEFATKKLDEANEVYDVMLAEKRSRLDAFKAQMLAAQAPGVAGGSDDGR